MYVNMKLLFCVGFLVVAYAAGSIVVVFTCRTNLLLAVAI